MRWKTAYDTEKISNLFQNLLGHVHGGKFCCTRIKFHMLHLRALQELTNFVVLCCCRSLARVCKIDFRSHLSTITRRSTPRMPAPLAEADQSGSNRFVVTWWYRYALMNFLILNVIKLATVYQPYTSFVWNPCTLTSCIVRKMQHQRFQESSACAKLLPYYLWYEDDWDIETTQLLKT